MDKRKERESNIELLRILAMLGVIILHYNNRDIGGAFLYTQDLSLNHAILLMFESISVCAVDLFIMISGYFLVEKNERNFLKVFQLVFQVSVFKVIIYLAREGLGRGGLTLKGIIGSLIPNNYFVILYCVLFVLSPLINFSIAKVSKRYQVKTFVLLILIFCICPSVVDVMNFISSNNWNGLSTIGLYGSQWGYTIVNFFLMYCIGAFIRNVDISRIKLSTSVLLQFFVIVMITLVAGLFDENIAWSYCSPLVVFEASLFMIIFLKIDIGSIKIINSLSKACFTCFLTHTVFLKFAGIRSFSTGSPVVLIMHVVLTGVAIFMICYVVDFAYRLITSIIWKKLDYERFMIKYEDEK